MAKKPVKNTTAKNTGRSAAKVSPKHNNWMLLPVAIIMGYVPLIMRTYQYDPGMSEFEWFEPGQVVDVCMACKMFVLLIIGFFMIGLFLIYRWVRDEKYPFDKRLIPLFVYMLFVLISGIASPFKAQAWGGSFEMFESVPVVLLYGFSAIYTFMIMEDADDFRFFWKIASPGILLECLICIGQGAGHNFIATKFAKYLYLSPPYWPQMETMSVDGGVASGTLYNPDFLPAYYAVMIPLSMAAFFFVRPVDYPTAAYYGHDQKWEDRRYLYERLYAGLVMVMTVLSLMASDRVTGKIVLIIEFAILLVGDFLVKKSQFFGFVIMGVVLVALFIGISFTDTYIGTSIKSIYTLTDDYTTKLYVDNLYNKPDEVEFVINDYGKMETFHAHMDVVEGSYINPDTGEEVPTRTPVVTLSCDDADGLSIYPADESNVTQIVAKEGDPNYSVSVTGYVVDDTYDEFGMLTDAAHQGLTVNAFGRGYSFDITEEGYKYRNYRGLDIDFPSEVELYRIFPDSFFHGRGYLYNYSIPLLKKYILAGCGSNAYVRAYPQNDYLYEPYHSLEAKPHCFYLQQWIENSLIALIAIVVFMIWIIISLIKLILEKHDSPEWQRGGVWRTLTISSLATTFSVMVVYIANDSNVCSSPVVWISLGLSLVCIRQGKIKSVNEGGK